MQEVAIHDSFGKALAEYTRGLAVGLGNFELFEENFSYRNRWAIFRVYDPYFFK